MSTEMRAALQRSQDAATGPRISRLSRGIDDMRKLFEIARRTGDAVRAKLLDKALAKFEKGVAEHLQEIRSLVTPARAAAKSAADRDLSLATAVEALARATGAGLWRVDSLHSQIVMHAAAGEGDYWAGVPEQRVSGLLQQRHNPELVEALKARGILTWFEWQDGRHRVVDTAWLTAHGDIRRFVTGEAERGKRCRFCRILETPESVNLTRVEPEGSLAGVIGVVAVHEQCLPYWYAWVAIAEQYASQADAEEADRAAGRAPKALPAPPTIEAEPEQKIPEGYTTRPYGPEQYERAERRPEVHGRPDGKVDAAELARRGRRARGES